jgi:hypothetical protein
MGWMEKGWISPGSTFFHPHALKVCYTIFGVQIVSCARDAARSLSIEEDFWIGKGMK